MACNCLSEIDAMLADRNTKLSPTILFGNPSTVVVTLVTETATKKRGARPVAMLPTYCPFCGVKYDDPPANLLDAVRAREVVS